MLELKPKQIQAAHLEAAGLRAIDIAKELKTTPQTISVWRKHDGYQVLVSMIAKTTYRATQLQMIELSSKAVKTINEIMDSDNDTVRLRAAEAVLKAVGVGGVENAIGFTSVVDQLTSQMQYHDSELEMMKEMHGYKDEYLSKFAY